MDVQAISSRAFSVYITERDLERRSLDPCSVTAAQAKDIVSSVIGGGDIGTVKLELFPGRHELLIFVRKGSGEPEFFSFENVDDVIDVLLACDGDETASLFFYDGYYILAVWSWDCFGNGVFCEFGEHIERPGGFLLHLREHGHTLADGRAVSVIKSAFSRV